jgi:hypothetical protein
MHFKLESGAHSYFQLWGPACWVQDWDFGYNVGSRDLPLSVLAGLVTHGWGMFAKRSIEQQLRESQRFWMDIVYWLCWGALVALLIYVFVMGAAKFN